MSNVTFTRKNSTWRFQKFLLVPVSLMPSICQARGTCWMPAACRGSLPPPTRPVAKPRLLLGWGRGGGSLSLEV